MTRIARTGKDIGTILRNARKDRGLTQAQLADQAGVWQRTVSNIETNAGDAKLGTVFDLLAALDLEIQVVPRSKVSRTDLEDIF